MDIKLYFVLVCSFQNDASSDAKNTVTIIKSLAVSSWLLLHVKLFNHENKTFDRSVGSLKYSLFNLVFTLLVERKQDGMQSLSMSSQLKKNYFLPGRQEKKTSLNHLC